MEINKYTFEKGFTMDEICTMELLVDMEILQTEKSLKIGGLDPSIKAFHHRVLAQLYDIKKKFDFTNEDLKLIKKND